ncbi:MAG: glycosyltransferase family 39 protein [Acidobacteria bacterium]|nr:glycosyltransferase family 39 protein [Acidobacteriota bacterium]
MKLNIFSATPTIYQSSDESFLSITGRNSGTVINARKFASSLIICLLFFSLIVWLQWLSGAFRNEFGGDPDEASHYVTGLMIGDYMTSLPLSSPMGFAKKYYLHYPKIALGHWPPLFYLVQGIWGKFFSPSRISMLLLMALTTALLALTVYRIVRSEFGNKAGIATGTLTILLPITQKATNLLMADMLFTLLGFWAVLCFGSYLDTEKARYAIGFGVLASLAILTKGNGFFLAIFPLLALVFSRRLYLLARASFWYPAAIVLLVCGPWYLLTRKMMGEIMAGELGLSYTREAIRAYTWDLILILGVGLSLVVVIGIFARIIEPFRERRVEGRWAAAGALLFSFWLFYCIVPSGINSRYVIVAAPSLLMFFVAGIAWAASRLPLGKLTVFQKVYVLTVLAATVFAAETFVLAKRPNYGFAEAARNILSKPELQNSVLLVASDAEGEGMFIAEVAPLEQKPGHIILRSSKVLSQSLWSGDQYQLLYHTPEEVMRYLDEIPVGIVVMGDWLFRSMFEHRDHYNQLNEVLKSYPQNWELLGSYPRRLDEDLGEIRVYRRIGHENKPINKTRIDMRSKLGEAVEN